MINKMRASIWVVLFASLCVFFPYSATAFAGGNQQQGEGGSGGGGDVTVPVRQGPVVKKDERWSLLSTESGQISAVKISDGRLGSYHLQFITMQPNTLFLPVYLQTDMVFYVNSGSGTLTWVDNREDSDDEPKRRQVKLQKGDVYRLPPGSFFYLRSNLGDDPHQLQIYAIFADSYQELLREGAYVSVRDIVLGFDRKVLEAGLGVNESLVEELKRGGRQPLIVAAGVPEKEEANFRMMRGFLIGSTKIDMVVNDKKEAYNIFKEKPDFENCNGWSSTVTRKQLKALKNSDFGLFMVNLTKGSMMGPHWNPRAAEIAVVLRGRGMVHVVCPSSTNETSCRNLRFRVEEGDVFVVPRYHPMAQISFNNDSFVFMGFTTTSKRSHPQYLAGKASVFNTLDSFVLATSFNVSKTTIDQLLKAQEESVILECTSCAEDEERMMEEEIKREREKEEAERRRQEEEAERQRQEEEAERQRQEEEARRQQEEEEARRQEEEAERRRQEEEARRRQEEEAERQRQEEEARRQQEEEEARRQEEEAERQRQEEEAKRQQEEEEARRQEEEAERRRQEEEARRRQEEEAERQRQEEEARRQQEEEEARRQEEEAERRRQEEEARRRQEEEAERQRQEEEARRQQEEEEAKRQEEEAERRRQEEEARRRQEEEAERQRQEEEARRQQEEEEARRQEEEAERQRQEEEARRQQEEEGRGGAGEEQPEQGEEAAAKAQVEEMERRQREAEEAAARAGQGQGQGGSGAGLPVLQENWTI